MSVSDNNVLSNTLSAASTFIGYIGTEVATTDCFDRLLWPQRAYNNFSLWNAWKPALLMPLGGPLHTAALKTIDTFFKHGLFRGPHMGHMLGTTFFPDTGMEYQLYEDGVYKRDAKARNGLWLRVLEQMPMFQEESPKKFEEKLECGREGKATIRQKIPVNHLFLSWDVTENKGRNKMEKPILIDCDIGPVTPRIVLAIITTEVTALGVSVVVAVVWRSAFMVLWLVPLILKLIAAFFTVPREPIPGSRSAPADSVSTKFLFVSAQGFQVIEGPSHVVQPFFRHYGHPKRRRRNEIVGMAVVIAYGLNFPIGLVVSIMCMPVGLQCVWTGYVLYVTMVLYISRYSHGHSWLTTEERIADALHYAEEYPGNAKVMFRGGVTVSYLRS
ncbi:hypothetical protein N7490_003212 [Penicillium lividum]|nr:hypothetical protein N7490_003212 [Penicillium lividum]